MHYVYMILRQAQGVVSANGCLPHKPRIASPKPQLRYTAIAQLHRWKESPIQVLTRPNVA